MRHPNLVGAWSLANTPNDFSGNGLHGAEVSVSYTDSWMGRAVTMNGSTSRVNVTDNALLKPAHISVEAFIETPATLSGYRALMSKVSSSAWSDGYGLLFNADNVVRMAINSWTIYAGYALAGSTRYHVVGTYDQQFIRMYVNGVLQASTAYTAAINHAAFDMRIGAPPTPDPAWNGKISYVRIYSGALRAEDVARLYFNLNPVLL